MKPVFNLLNLFTFRSKAGRTQSPGCEIRGWHLMWVTLGEKKSVVCLLLRYLKIHFTNSTFCTVLLTFLLVYRRASITLGNWSSQEMSRQGTGWRLSRSGGEYSDAWSFFWSFVSLKFFTGNLESAHKQIFLHFIDSKMPSIVRCSFISYITKKGLN